VLSQRAVDSDLHGRRHPQTEQSLFGHWKAGMHCVVEFGKLLNVRLTNSASCRIQEIEAISVASFLSERS
jgi:hypothetical protein